MAMFSDFNKHNSNTEEELPWYRRPSIFRHIESNLDDEGRLPEKDNDLPDEEKRYKDGEIRWASGHRHKMDEHSIIGWE